METTGPAPATANASPSTTRRLPDWLGLGAPKTATTFLAACLREHPSLYVPEVKEPHYFSFTIEEGQTLDDYASYFEDASAEQLAGEFSVSYLEHREAPTRVKAAIPEVKLIASVREPVSLLYSWYWQAKRQNFWQMERNEWDLSFEDAIERYDQLLRAVRMGSSLERWLGLFPREQIHILVQDDIKADQANEVRRLYEFLGVDPTFTPDAFRAQSTGKAVHGGVSPKAGAVGWAYGTLYRAAVVGGVRPLRKLLGERGAKDLLARLRVRDIARKVFFKRGYPPMDEATHRRLTNQLRPEVEKLESILGRDLSTWKAAER